MEKENFGFFNEQMNSARISNGGTKSSLLIIPKVKNINSRLPQTNRMRFEKSKNGNYSKFRI